jgi:hypothetical protein
MSDKIDFDSEIYVVLEKIQNPSMGFVSVKNYLIQLASYWPREKLIELLTIVTYRIRTMNCYINEKLNSDIKFYENKKAFGSILCPIPVITGKETIWL